MTRLLALDDNLDSAELVARVGTKCGYEAKAISDPRSLPDLVRTWNPAVITLDLCMPQEDGIVVLSTLQQAGFEGDLFIVSGQDSWLRNTAGRLASALGLKVTGDFSKPVDLTALRTALTKLKPVESDAAAPVWE